MTVIMDRYIGIVCGFSETNKMLRIYLKKSFSRFFSSLVLFHSNLSSQLGFIVLHEIIVLITIDS